MSDFIQVDMDRVKAAATNIAKYNNIIRDDISSVEAAMNALNNSWDGQASTVVINKFHEIKNAYSEPRYNVVNNYVIFLNQLVDPAYTQAETTLKKLADYFK